MVEIIHYGLIGCGMMGQEHMRNIALLPDAKVSAIYEPDAKMAAQGAAIDPSAKRVDSIAELLAIDELDCVVIASPNYLHVEQLEQLAAQRPLPVLVEKPLFTALEDTTRLETIMANYPAPVWVAMEYRYMPPIAALLEQADTVTGGIRMLTIREHRFPFLEKVGDWNRFNRYTGGTFVEKCCHFFDLMRLALQSEPVRVMASGSQDVNHLGEAYAGEVPDILDNGYAIVDFANGSRAMLELCMFAEGSMYQEQISAVGPNGKIEAMVPGPVRFWPDHLGAPPTPKLIVSPRGGSGPEIHDVPVDPDILDAGDHNGSTFYQHQRFLEVIHKTRAHPEVTYDDGRMAVLMGKAAQISIAEGRVVRMDEMV